MSATRRAIGTLALVGLLVALVGCSSDGTSGANRGSAVVTGTGGTAPGDPAPIGVTSLDGVKARLQPVAGVDAPTALTARPGTGKLYVTEQAGLVKLVDGLSTVLDLTARTETQGERGLLGIAFSADGSHLYAYYTAEEDGRVTIDEFAMTGDRADPATRRNLLSIEHPRANHNGGQLQLGPDGFLYIGVGDGGGGGDPDHNGQNPMTLLGKILRIDPTARTGSKPYGIPEGNPFADGTTGAPEVWAFGLRNPWRFSFDRATKDLWIGDVGQNLYEEIDFLPDGDGGAGRGANLGWNLMEGTHPYEGGSPPADYTPPIFDYGHDNGECSVTGGYVYRGSIAAWQGVYVFADYCQGEIRLLLRTADGGAQERGTGLKTATGSGTITSFGEDADGELLVLSQQGGVFRLVAA